MRGQLEADVMETVSHSVCHQISFYTHFFGHDVISIIFVYLEMYCNEVNVSGREREVKIKVYACSTQLDQY